MMSFCCDSRMDRCDAEMVGSGGKSVFTADASFDFATDEGSVSGSNSAFRIRASFADSDVLIRSTTISGGAMEEYRRCVQDFRGEIQLIRKGMDDCETLGGRLISFDVGLISLGMKVGLGLGVTVP